MEPYLGQIKLVSFKNVPKGWHLCDGTLLNITQNQALFSLLYTTYGGDGKTTFGLPDLRGRVVVGTSSAQRSYVQGTKGGAAAVTLTAANFPAHTHALNASNTPGTVSTATDTIFSQVTSPSALAMYAPPSNPAVPLAAMSILPAGGGAAHPNMQPYLTLNYIIATSGVYPQRPE